MICKKLPTDNVHYRPAVIDIVAKIFLSCVVVSNSKKNDSSFSKVVGKLSDLSRSTSGLGSRDSDYLAGKEEDFM